MKANKEIEFRLNFMKLEWNFSFPRNLFHLFSKICTSQDLESKAL